MLHAFFCHFFDILYEKWDFCLIMPLGGGPMKFLYGIRNVVILPRHCSQPSARFLLAIVPLLVKKTSERP